MYHPALAYQLLHLVTNVREDVAARGSTVLREVITARGSLTQVGQIRNGSVPSILTISIGLTISTEKPRGPFPHPILLPLLMIPFMTILGVLVLPRSNPTFQLDFKQLETLQTTT